MVERPTSIKMVLVGDGVVGKTCMLVSYTSDKFPEEYVPTVFQNYSASLKVDGKIISLAIWDTAGQEEYAKLRALAYNNCDVFVVVFDVTDPASFTNVCKKWVPELVSLAPSAIKLVVGNKIDLRKPENEKHVKRDQAQKTLKELGVPYCECSARTQEGLKEVFQQGILMVLKAKAGGRKDGGCALI